MESSPSFLSIAAPPPSVLPPLALSPGHLPLSLAFTEISFNLGLLFPISSLSNDFFPSIFIPTPFTALTDPYHLQPTSSLIISWLLPELPCSSCSGSSSTWRFPLPRALIHPLFDCLSLNHHLRKVRSPSYPHLIGLICLNCCLLVFIGLYLSFFPSSYCHPPSLRSHRLLLFPSFSFPFPRLHSMLPPFCPIWISLYDYSPTRVCARLPSLPINPLSPIFTPFMSYCASRSLRFYFLYHFLCPLLSFQYFWFPYFFIMPCRFFDPDTIFQPRLSYNPSAFTSR